MNAGRQLDARVSEEVFGRTLVKQKKLVYEQTEKGSRPLAEYSTDMNFAWEVANRMRISMMPIEGGQWFAIVGRDDQASGWKSPADFIAFLQEGNFANAGAAIGVNAAEAICLAAIKAVENRRSRAAGEAAGLATDVDATEGGASDAAPDNVRSIAGAAGDGTRRLH